MSFDYSTMKIGDAVEVSTSPDFSNPAAGVVSVVEPDCCFIAVAGSATPPLEFCWHEDDDRLAGGYEQFYSNQELYSGENQPLGPRTGVFRKARNQIILEEAPEKIAALERMVARQEARLRALEAAPAPEQPKRRGRPPKQKEPALEGAF